MRSSSASAARFCRRYTPVGTLAARTATGAGRVAFAGRVKGKALAPGAYRLTVQAGRASEQVAASRSITFTILR